MNGVIRSCMYCLLLLLLLLIDRSTAQSRVKIVPIRETNDELTADTVSGGLFSGELSNTTVSYLGGMQSKFRDWMMTTNDLIQYSNHSCRNSEQCRYIVIVGSSIAILTIIVTMFRCRWIQ